MMVVSLLLILNFSIGVSANSGYDRQEADATSEEEFLNLRISPISASIQAADIGVMLGIV